MVGVIGGGQLARMMYEAATGLGLRMRLLAEGPDTSAATVVHDVTVGDYTDPATVKAFAAGCDVITFDHEHVPTEPAARAGGRRDRGPARPGGPGARAGQGGDAGSVERAGRSLPDLPGGAGCRRR